jgi:selenocysteine lyase/cysteine desulfurase
VTAEPLTCQRSEFSLPEDVHYLNCAYMAPLPRGVQEAGVAGIGRKANPGRGIVTADFFSESTELRRLFAQLIGADRPERIAIIPSVSYGMATVARNTPVRRGQNIVVSGEEFPSSVHTWRRAARNGAAELRVVDPPPDGKGRGVSWNTRVLEAIDADTAVVSLSHVHWTDGTRFDLAAIGREARQHGAALIVDGTQSIGAMPFDMQGVQPDALICAGYKWLLGPYSIGAAYYGPRYDGGEPLEESWISRHGSEDFQRLIDYQDGYAAGAARYDVGERSNFILLPMFTAALRMLLEWTPQRVQDYCGGLVREPIERMCALGFGLEDEAWRGTHLFGVRAPAGLDLSTLQQALRRRNVFASLRGSALRVSPNVYNDAADLDALVQGLTEAAGPMR